MSWLLEDISKSLYFCWVRKVVCFHFVLVFFLKSFPSKDIYWSIHGLKVDDIWDLI